MQIDERGQKLGRASLWYVVFDVCQTGPPASVALWIRVELLAYDPCSPFSRDTRGQWTRIMSNAQARKLANCLSTLMGG